MQARLRMSSVWGYASNKALDRLRSVFESLRFLPFLPLVLGAWAESDAGVAC